MRQAKAAVALVTTVLFAACSSSVQSPLPNLAGPVAPTFKQRGPAMHTLNTTLSDGTVIVPAGQPCPVGTVDAGTATDSGGSQTTCVPDDGSGSIGSTGSNPYGGHPITPPALPCDPTSQNCVAVPNGPAQYGDQCNNGAEAIGHDVPGLPPSKSVEITNEYPVTLGTTLIGYVYTTWGTGHGANGIAYFVPLPGSVGAGIVSIGTDTAFAVGTNGWVQGSAGGTALNVLVQIMTLGKAPSMKNACFTSDWNGTYPGALG